MAMSFGSFASRVVATKVVATDGTGDFIDIQTAIDNLPAGGGVVYVKEGTYNITAAITLATDNIHLIGAGASSYIHRTDGGIVINISGDKCGVEKFKLLSDGGPNPCGIHISGTDCLINDNWVTAALSGIRGEFAGKIIITGNILDGAGLGIEVTSAGAGAEHCIIDGNMVYNSENGIAAYTINYVVISNNICFSNSDDGIWINEVDYSVITGNISKGNTKDGISITEDPTSHHGDFNTITGNICSGNGQYGIQINANCDKTIVVGNMCLNNTSGGIDDNGTLTELGHNITA